MSPRLLHIYGPFWITAYGLFTALGLAAFLISAYYHPSRKRYLTDDQFYDIGATGVIAGLLGGKVLFLLQEGAGSLGSLSEFLEIVRGGFAILGAMVGATLGIMGYACYHNIKLLPVLDIAGRYALLAHGIARWGCFFAGCCYGMPALASSAFAVVYADSMSLAPLHTPLYASQIMMSVGSFTAFFIINCIIARFKQRPAGSLFIWYIMLESANRFIVDFWRGDRVAMVTEQGTWFLQWSAYQNIALLIIGGCLMALTALHFFDRREG